jgi:hypothetical protein
MLTLPQAPADFGRRRVRKALLKAARGVSISPTACGLAIVTLCWNGDISTNENIYLCALLAYYFMPEEYNTFYWDGSREGECQDERAIALLLLRELV